MGWRVHFQEVWKAHSTLCEAQTHIYIYVCTSYGQYTAAFRYICVYTHMPLTDLQIRSHILVKRLCLGSNTLWCTRNILTFDMKLVHITLEQRGKHLTSPHTIQMKAGESNMIALSLIISFKILGSTSYMRHNNNHSFVFFLLQVKIWFQNHRYKCKRQAKEKAMAEQNQHNQVNYNNNYNHRNNIIISFELNILIQNRLYQLIMHWIW